jgi:hypothetical protein
MPMLSEFYRGYEIRINLTDRPPYDAGIRRLDSWAYEESDIQADSKEEVLAAARKRVNEIADD